jgi:PIN domain nuclease of toxin-antitoxin system
MVARGRDRPSTGSGPVTLLLDTHFLIWLVLESKRLGEFPWLERHRPWGVSPVSFLEIQLLAEIGRLSVHNPEFTNAVMEDPRFTVDDIPLATVIRHGLKLDWTRDPFDRMLVAHSLARRMPLCTVDRRIRTHHRLIVAE